MNGVVDNSFTNDQIYTLRRCVKKIQVLINRLVGTPCAPFFWVFFRLHLFEGLWPILDKIFTLFGVAVN